jgi:hypothetical protein
MRTSRSTLPIINAATALAVVGLVFAQAVIAGRSTRLFGSWSIELHGMLGNIVFLLAAGACVGSFAAKAGRRSQALTIALLILTMAQLGLGYSGRQSLSSAAWHIPVGVATFGVAVLNATTARDRVAVSRNNL